ncbi:copper resistance CopC/CopD family protein [Cohnella pontilimi]|nr:copper resistance protein CopC [Cohnella pontilimi]
MITIFQIYSIYFKRLGRLLGFAVLTLWLTFGGFVPAADAHAELVRAAPEAGDQSAESPASVELVFNERLDPGGMKLSVLDEKLRAVTEDKPERIEQGKGMRLPLPKLGEGHYTVSYSVISADGHPVFGAYVFTVGNPAPLPGASKLDPHEQVGHSANHGSSVTQTAYRAYGARILYYMALLITSGLVMWSVLNRNASPLVREVREYWLGIAGKCTLLATLAYVVLSMTDLLQEDLYRDGLRILMDTTIGRLYVAEVLLAIAATLLVSLGDAARLFWAAMFLFIEAWSGHAAVYTPKAYTIGLDFVHLAAASLWVGGLVLLLAVWRKERPEAGRFALVFSRWALYSFLVLWVTGALSVLAFLPSLDYLLYTSWGTWLLIKIGVSILVAVAALIIRGRLRKGSLPQGALLKVDAGFMTVIVFIVGIFTYQTPLPANEPLHYHEMGTDLHYTLRISPNAPGDNSFTVKVWLPESAGQPKRVALRLLPLKRDDVGYIEVPLKPYQDQEIDAFPGYGKFTYQAQGPFLPFAGKWKAQVRVTDAHDNETVKEMQFRIY